MTKTRSIVAGMALAFTLASLSGCVIVVGADGDSGMYWAGSHDHGDSRADRALAHKIRDQFDASAMLEKADIEIYVDDSDVLLKGEAPSGAAIDEAIRLAKSVGGVDEVTSKLEVGND